MRKLPVAYRSTRQIILPASSFVLNSKHDEFFSQYVGEDNINSLFHEDNGRAPELLIVDEKEILKRLTRNIISVIKGGLSYSDIAVICPYKRQTKKIAEHLEQMKIPVYWLVKNSESKKNYKITENKVIITTIHSAKGLEFEKVYFLYLDSLPMKELNERENASMIYVGMTRAKHHLTMIATKETEIIRKLRENLKKYSQQPV